MQERLNSNNSKRDMRKKVVKSDRPTYKKRIRKGQTGMRFVSYTPVSNPTVEFTDITNPINPFSEYNYSTTYNKPEALVVPIRDNDVVATDDVVVDKPTAVASKVVVNNTANSTWRSPYNDRSKWVADLTSAYKRAGITNDNAIKMLLAQDALESGWGKSAQGKFNFGNLTTGAKWKGDYVDGRDKNAKGEAIKQRFRSYNSMDEYAADKIQFLKRLYDFNENDDINKFTAKLTGANKGKRRYAEATNYAKLLTGVYNGTPKGQNGLVVNRDAIQDYQPNIPPERIKRTYSFGDLGGEPAPDITPEQRWQRQKRDRTIEDWKGLLRGLNNTAGRAASLASLIYGGGWATTRLLNGNKSSVVGQALSKYVLPSNTYDTIGDVGQLIEDPSISNAAEVGIGIGLGKWRDFSKTGRQITELGSQALNAYNSFKAGGIIKAQHGYKAQLGKTEFHENWYKPRIAILGKNEKDSGTGLGNLLRSDKGVGQDEYNRIIGNIRNTDEVTYDNVNPYQRGVIKEYINKVVTSKDEIPEEKALEYNKMLNKAVTYKDASNPFILYKNTSPTIKVHERTHAGNAWRQELLIKRKNIKGVGKDSKYLDNPSEIYSRLMQVRFDNHLNPMEIITDDKIEELRKSGKDSNLLNRYDNETLKFLFNGIASNTNKKSSTRFVKRGGIIKYQNPPHGIARRDAIKDYRPNVPPSPIKRIYVPTQQPTISQDNRSKWERKQSDDYKAQQVKNDNLYKNQHTWNWSAPFTNARITKDNASAMFDFDKSATMSTFAIGTGIANPVSTATSLAGSLVGSGIGNKVAGDKGALVGGFVGGMINPRFGMRFNKKNSSSNIKQPIIMAKESKLTPEEIAGMPKGERNQPIKSKLDWKNWSKGGPISKEHLAEYAQIERDARRRGYWLVTSNGRAWEGDPRTWVQLMSKDGSRFKKGKFPSNNDLYYSGINGDDIIYDDYNGRLWASSSKTTARSYTNSDDRVMTIGVPNDSKTFEVDAQGKYWQDLPNPYTGKKSTTDEIVNDIFDKGNDVALIKNVRDNGPHVFYNSPKYKSYDPLIRATDMIINRKAPRKSLVGNNGDFNINNPNVYKVLAPFLIGMSYGYDKWIY